MKKIFFLAMLLMAISCKIHYVTDYKVITPKGNFYVNKMDIVIKHDSVFMIEINPNGKIRRGGAFKVDEVIIEN
jgi:hypothetical protein